MAGAENAKIRLIMDLRRRGITDARVMDALERVPRESFVDVAQRSRAWEDRALPAPYGQSISQPYIVALMTQALELNDRCVVLEVGTSTGYQAAVLSHLARRVYTIERIAPLLKQAEARFAELGLRNVVTRLGDGQEGWPEGGPFDRIIVTAAAEAIPQHLVEQLKPGGIMLIPVGPKDGDQDLLSIRRESEGVTVKTILAVRFVPLESGVKRGG